MIWGKRLLETLLPLTESQKVTSLHCLIAGQSLSDSRRQKPSRTAGHTVPFSSQSTWESDIRYRARKSLGRVRGAQDERGSTRPRY
jgi:hypothetical protein